MTERIDHAQQAVDLINHPFPAPPSYLVEAQIHATLALVEQQRIANLIALHRHEVKHDIGSWSRLYETGSNPEAVLKPGIAEGLGIE